MDHKPTEPKPGLFKNPFISSLLVFEFHRSPAKYSTFTYLRCSISGVRVETSAGASAVGQV